MANTEGRILLGIQAYRLGRFSSLRAAASAYGAPRSTMTSRLKGVPAKSSIPSANRKLTSTEETTLINWILDMDTRGMPLTQLLVRDAANLLLADRATRDASTQPTVGKRWVSRFISRHPQLKSKYNRKYDYQRAKCEDPEVIQGWFRLVRNTIEKYRIVEDDIYNFDETGFQMGVISTSKVVTGTDSRTVSVQPGNREWVTVIESIQSTGFVLPPLVILKGQMHQYSWYQNLPTTWLLGVSDNGWTTDELGLIWLQEVFEMHTRNRTIGTYRLLILNGHGSHVTAQFDRFCKEHCIIALCMPAHSSQFLQPLDVSCFAGLKRFYGQAVQQQMRVGINHIDKIEFLQLYQSVRQEAFTVSTVQSGFKATGLVPFDPDQVLNQLHVRLRTPTPLPTTEPVTAWVSETPHNIAELQLQTDLVQKSIRYRTQSPPSPTVQAVNQLIKRCQLAMHNATLLAAENRKLRAANERVKKKRAVKKSFVRKGGVLQVSEVQNKLNQATADIEVVNQVVDQNVASVRTRAPAKCSICKSLEHTARTCPDRQ